MVSSVRRYFDCVVDAAIIATPVIFVWSLLDEPHAELIESIDLAVLWFFAFEVLIRRICGERGRAWWVDTAIVAFSLLPMGANLAALRVVVRSARLLHVGKHVAHLRHVAALRWVRRRFAAA